MSEPLSVLENNPTVDRLSGRFGDAILKTEVFRNELTVIVKRDGIHEVLKFLKEDPALAYDLLVDLTAVDYLKAERSPRFQVVYLLRSMKTHRRVRIKIPVPENDPKVATMTDLWKAADWLEREVYEMYGITFNGHPDLRRLLTPDSFTHYPLRKDYPLRGMGERDILLPEGS